MGYLLLNRFKLCASDVTDTATNLVSCSKIARSSNKVVVVVAPWVYVRSVTNGHHTHTHATPYRIPTQVYYQSFNLYLASLWLVSTVVSIVNSFVMAMTGA